MGYYDSSRREDAAAGSWALRRWTAGRRYAPKIEGRLL